MMNNHFKLLVVVVALGATPAFADRPLHCQSADHKYVLNVDTEEPIRAKLYVDGNLAQFGELSCVRESDHAGRNQIVCHSQNVADGGYNAILVPQPSHYTASLEEESFMGARHLADLDCDF